MTNQEIFDQANGLTREIVKESGGIIAWDQAWAFARIAMMRLINTDPEEAARQFAAGKP